VIGEKSAQTPRVEDIDETISRYDLDAPRVVDGGDVDVPGIELGSGPRPRAGTNASAQQALDG